MLKYFPKRATMKKAAGPVAGALIFLWPVIRFGLVVTVLALGMKACTAYMLEGSRYRDDATWGAYFLVALFVSILGLAKRR